MRAMILRCVGLLMTTVFVVIMIPACKQSNQDQHTVEVQQLLGQGAHLPRLVSLPNNEALMSWVEPVGKAHALKFAKLKNGHILSQGEVARGENWFINWADFPSVAPISKDFWLAHRLVKKVGGKAYDYDVVLSLSNNAGQTWRDIGSPHRDGLAAEHGFAAIFAEGDDAGIIWLDGREYFEKKDAAKYPNKSGNFSLRYTRVHPDGSMEAEQVIDNNTCTCCWPAATVSTAGPVAAWRSRTDQEIRDNQFAVLRDGKWNAPAPLGNEGWHIDGCPVNGPSLSARGKHVVAAWFSAADDKPRVRVAFSKDGGLTFGRPVDVDAASPLGRIGLVWRDDNTAVVSWMTAADSTGKQSNLALRTINLEGEMSDVKYLAEVSTGRDTGVPQMAATEQGVLLAWTNAESTHGIKTTIVPWVDLTKQNILQKVSDMRHALFVTKPAIFLASICTNPH